ncbi:MAG: hypothetical protein F6K40_18215 [Okeania sp. SIO3I5]|uniref:hypothetical protein n=1 Tax=Okeania sp. SIO3I5 TaxID=2607805 RepID=UPI0013B6BFCB|nr:hypothetical protein [Okeania sp. SIO3I5]NEQ38092.1 hypothetical protein [Okeania sp. SIO3I5]
MELDSFIEQEYRIPLQEALTRWGDDIYDYQQRRNFLNGASFDAKSIRKFPLNTNNAPSLAMALIIEFSKPNFNSKHPNFHPLVAFLKNLYEQDEKGIEIYELSDTDKTLFYLKNS